MSLRSRAQSVGRITGTVVGFYAVALAFGMPWLWLVGERWQTVSEGLFRRVVLLAPIVTLSLGLVMSYAFSKRLSHENMVSQWQWRVATAMGLLWILSPAIAYWLGGWWAEHKFWFLLITPLATFFVRRVVARFVRSSPSSSGPSA